MRVEVDLAVCENHGQCVFAAPEVFAFDDDERLAYVAEPAAELATAVRSAAAACPVRAITLVEE
ncbi:ferredoxin [Kribbella sancticallisti]|uniref:Ferredoxin n=1 Tax=Kribbella sancticallisti TaxID=460087 RepID=A0ABN2EWN7_9ACTN